MKRLLAVLVAASMMLPFVVREPSRPEPDAERRIAAVMDDDPDDTSGQD